MSINRHGPWASMPAHGLSGKDKSHSAFSGAVAAIKAFAHACADAWAFAHRTRRLMGFSDEAGTSLNEPERGRSDSPAPGK